MDANMINLTDAFKDYETAARALKIRLLSLTFVYLGFSGWHKDSLRPLPLPILRIGRRRAESISG